MKNLSMKIALELAGMAEEIIAGRPRMTKEEFVGRARRVHGDRYDYSSVNMDNRDEKGRVLIRCRKCGTKFWQRPDKHLDGNGCMTCYIEENGIMPGESNIDLPAEEQTGIDENKVNESIMDNAPVSNSNVDTNEKRIKQVKNEPYFDDANTNMDNRSKSLNEFRRKK